MPDTKEIIDVLQKSCIESTSEFLNVPRKHLLQVLEEVEIKVVKDNQESSKINPLKK